MINTNSDDNLQKIRILFWNVNKKNLDDLVAQIATHHDVDIIVLNEHTSTNTLNHLQTSVKETYYVPNIIQERNRFHCFCRNTKFGMEEIHDGSRTSFRRLNVGTKVVLLALVHGVDVRNYDVDARRDFCGILVDDILFVTGEQKNTHVILLGDFNMNPYEPGICSARGLNAMTTKGCTERGTRTFLGTKYDFYYNPMWSLFGDNSSGPAGTIYDKSPQGKYGWSMFDQVIVHHSLVNLFDEVEILDHTGQTSLAKCNGRPDSSEKSDHFPILVTLQVSK